MIEIKEKPWDLLVVNVIAALLTVITLIINVEILRVFLGFTVVLFLPGYAIISALFPKAEGLDNIERVALSFGISVAVVPLVGLILNYSPWGIRIYPMLISLFLLISIFSIIAWYRRNQLKVEDRFNIVISIKLPNSAELETIDKLLAILLAVAIIFAICIAAYVIIIPKKGEDYTEFYLLDENRTMNNYPNNLKNGENRSVYIGVVCNEYETTKYTIEIRLINQTGERVNRTLQSYNLTLNHNHYYEIEYKFKVSENGTYIQKFLLYINDIDEPYRELYMWIHVTS
jgi:uncharacterized membrane protein